MQARDQSEQPSDTEPEDLPFCRYPAMQYSFSVFGPRAWKTQETLLADVPVEGEANDSRGSTMSEELTYDEFEADVGTLTVHSRDSATNPPCFTHAASSSTCSSQRILGRGDPEPWCQRYPF